MNARRTIAPIVLILSCLAFAQTRRAPGYGGPIAEGTQVQIRMIDSLSSGSAHEGDTFHATLDQPIIVNGRTLYPKDCDVTGTITRAHPSGRLSDPGELELTLTSISTGGRSYPISTQPWQLKGESHTKSNAGKIGGGAALGAIIGAVAGGGKGAAIGAGVGAGAGTGVAAATGKKEATIESEALLTFVTTASDSAYAGTPAAQRDRSYNDSYSDDRPYATSRSRSSEDSRDYARDSSRPRPFRTEFTSYDRRQIRDCFSDSSNLPPGLARREDLPPGLERQVERNGTLPPGLQNRVQPLPEPCSANLPRLPADWSRVVLGRRVLMLDPDSRITDLFSLEGTD